VADLEIKRLPRLAASFDEQCQETTRARGGKQDGCAIAQEKCQFVANHEGDHITARGKRWKSR
jgi:hypothetical protein